MATISAMAAQTTALYNLTMRGISLGQGAAAPNSQVSSLASVYNSSSEYAGLLKE